MTLPPHFVSKDEGMFYYSGISPSPPKPVYRTGLLTTPWVKPKGPEAYRKLEQVCGVFNHRLNDVWEDLGSQVRDLLNVQRISWTSIDVARFITDGESDTAIVGPVVLWIGVRPGSLEGAPAFSSGAEILEILKSFGIEDVEVEYRESIYMRSAGPELLRHVSKVNDTVDVRSPLTPTLSLSIATADSPDAQGTLGLRTPPPTTPTSSRTTPALLANTFNFSALALLTSSSTASSRASAIMLQQHDEGIERLEKRLAGGVDGDDDDEDEVAEAKKELELTRAQSKAVNDAIKTLEQFFAQVKMDWGAPRQRVIGHIRSSPAVAFNVGTEGFTEDWGAFEIDGPKFAKAFKGNVLDLGEFRFVLDLSRFRPPSLTITPRCTPATKYPSDRLLPLRGMISQELMRRPDMLDHDNEPCLIVIKSGSATGVTIGRATGLFSLVRDDDTGEESREWAIYNYDKNSGVFSARGDSGSIVVDGRGRIGGLPTGGAGKTETSDVTYVTPMFWLWPRIKEHFPNAHLELSTNLTFSDSQLRTEIAGKAMVGAR
ncbi:hypothetical protein B0H34DRAFT_794449 [Crassisporium funariophilum]|nr:hypothetical protein B0H34DRAFT_794449 [Crassisporium funariophilum]